MNTLTMNSRVGQRSALAGLGVDWGGIFANVASTAVNYRLTDLSKKRDAANTALRIAEQEAAARTAAAQRPPSIMSRIPVIPIAIGGAVLLGGYLLLRRKKGRK